MSDADPNAPVPPTPKTSAVPLKKETVRITLRARPGAGVTQAREETAPVSPIPQTAKKATAPIQLPSAPLPPPAPKSSTTPVTLPPAPMPPPAVAAPRPVAPPTAAAPGAPTAPRPVAPAVPGAPRPVAPGAPRQETGAMTTPLAPRPVPRPVGAGTAPMAAGPGTTELPKATVKLQIPGAGAPAPRPRIATPSAAPVKRAAQQDAESFDDDKDPEAGLVPLSVVCMVLSIVLLVVQMLGTDVVTSAPANQPSPLMVPEVTRVDWENPDATGAWKNSFDRILPQIPQ